MTDDLSGEVYLQVPRRSALNYQVISNSEMQTFMACEKRHYFGFGLGLRSRNHNEELQHGILGHEVLAAYYKARQRGKDHKSAKLTAMDVYHESDVEHLIKLQSMKRLLEYFDYYANEEFEVVAVETPAEVERSNSIYGFTLDLLLRDSRGQFVLRDHKFVGRFWNDNKPKYEPQLFKYVYACRSRGYDIRRAEYNFIKYVDATNGEHFKRMPLYLNDRKIQSIMEEHDKIAERIIAKRKLPIAQYKTEAIKNLSWACEWCPFKVPCEMELEGRDISRVLRVDFEPGDYGYQRD